MDKPKVGMISLGCAKNLVDAEIMLASVLQHGMEITSVAEEADVLIVNTCAFIDSAKEESVEAILQAHQQRGLRRKPGQKLIVAGCMAQRFAKELVQELPEVDAFIGLDQVAGAGEIVAITGIPEIVIPGKTGFLYAPGEMEDFVTRVLFLQRLVCSEGRYATSPLDWLRHAARLQVLHNFNHGKNLRQFGDRFLQLTGAA